MKRHRSESDTITGIAEATAERVRLGGELLQALAHAIAANQKVQRKFQFAVVHKLARMEVLLGLVRVAQMARDQRPFHYYEDKLQEQAQAAEEYVSRASDESERAMVKYIYGTESEGGVPARGRRK